jgi:hypothetical protein
MTCGHPRPTPCLGAVPRRDRSEGSGPGTTAGALAGRRAPALGRGARLAAAPIDALTARFARVGPPPPPDPAGTTEVLTPDLLADQVATMAKRLRLYPDYDDPAWLAWAFAELGRLTDRGHLTARLVRGTSGRVLGWFVYLLPEAGVAEVVQIGATGDPAPVLDHLVRCAHDEGAAAVQGRLEPVTASLLGAPGVLVRRGSQALVHAGDPAVLGLLSSTTSLCSVLDGEWLVARPALRWVRLAIPAPDPVVGDRRRHRLCCVRCGARRRPHSPNTVAPLTNSVHSVGGGRDGSRSGCW